MGAMQPEATAVRSFEDLPAPKGLPLVGNVFQIDSMQFHVTLENWARALGPMYRFKGGPRKLMVVSDPSIIATLLRDRPDAMRRTFRSARAFEELGTTGVFNAEGDDWRRQRKLVMKALTPEVIRNFFPTLVALTERLLRRWEKAVAAGQSFDVLRDLKAWTLDVTIWLAMGQDIDTLEHATTSLQRASSRTSWVMNTVLSGDLALSAAASSSPALALMSVISTLAPCATMASASARPRPEAAPVTSATLFCNRDIKAISVMRPKR